MILLADIRYIDLAIKDIKCLWKSKKCFPQGVFLIFLVGLPFVGHNECLCWLCLNKTKKYVILSFMNDNIYLAPSEA